MGFGGLIDSKGQNSLTNLETSVNLIGGEMQYQEANAQAGALQKEASNVFLQSQVEVEQAKIQGRQAYGQQAEGFAQSGVELTGSPSELLHQTSMQTAQQVALLTKQGQLQQDLLLTQANQTQQQGLAALMGAEGQNQITQEQNQVTQYEQKMQILEQMFSGIIGFGGNLLGSAMPTILDRLLPP